jgi:hypothetical protein
MADDIRTAETRSSRTPWNRGKLTGPKPSIRPTSRRRGKAGHEEPFVTPKSRHQAEPARSNDPCTEAGVVVVFVHGFADFTGVVGGNR